MNHKRVIHPPYELLVMINNRTQESELINYIELIKPEPNFDQIITYNDPNTCFSLLRTIIHNGYFDLAKIIHHENKSLLAKSPDYLWQILVTMINSKSETDDFKSFESGLELFEIAYKLYTPQVLNNHRGLGKYNPLHSAAKLKTTRATQMLILHGLDLEIRQDGLTPLMIAIINKNIDMVKLFVEAGAKTDAIAMDDIVQPNEHKFGYQCLCNIWIDKNLPNLPKPIGLDCSQLALALFDHYKKYNALEKLGELPMILDYLKVKYEIPSFECAVCLLCIQDPIKLNCGHLFCNNCLILLQNADFVIVCPCCRAITHMNPGLKMRLIIKSLAKDTFYECIAQRTTVSDLVRDMQKTYNKFIRIYHNNKSLEITDNTNIIKYGLKSDAVIFIIMRLPHQFTEDELKEWNSGKHSIVFSPD